MVCAGLLEFIHKSLRRGDVKELNKKKVAIDTIGLLRRYQMGPQTQSFVCFVNIHVQLLLSMGCNVVLVIDGHSVPKITKQGEVRLTISIEDRLRDQYQQSTPREFVEDICTFFGSFENVAVQLAPSEVVAQLAFMMQNKMVDAVLTDDTELILFGSSKIYFHWQTETGQCSVYEESKLKECFHNFDLATFRRACVLAGCGLAQPVVSLQTATEFVTTPNGDVTELIQEIPPWLVNAEFKEIEHFAEGFELAQKRLDHQLVWNPKKKTHQPLKPIPEEIWLGETANYLANCGTFSGALATLLVLLVPTAKPVGDAILYVVVAFYTMADISQCLYTMVNMTLANFAALMAIVGQHFGAVAAFSLSIGVWKLGLLALIGCCVFLGAYLVLQCFVCCQTPDEESAPEVPPSEPELPKRPAVFVFGMQGAGKSTLTTSLSQAPRC
ncbi:unnamed protein product [Caenorhabditis nigoni]